MLAELRSTLASLVFLKEEEAKYTARFVAYLLPLSALLVLLVTVFPLMAGNFTQRLEIGGPLIAALVYALYLLRQGKVRLPALIFIIGTWVVETYAIVMRGGVRAPAFVSYLVLIIYAAFLVTPTAALGVLAISLLVGLGAVVAAHTGVLPPSVVVHTPLTLYANYAAHMLMTTLIVLMITAEYRDAFGRLRESEARFRALFAAMTDVILVINREGRYLEVAPTSPELLYQPARELLGRTLHDVLPSAQADLLLKHIQCALETSQTTHLQYSLPIGGSEVHFAAAVSPLSPDSVILVARDLTAQVEQYEHLLAAERARASLAEHMNSEINHRARNNLAMVSGLLYMQATQTSELNVADALKQAVARIRTFVNIHEQVYASGMEEVDLLEVLQEMTKELGAVFPSRHAGFSVEGESYRCPTQDATNLAVAANELLMNALKHGRVEESRELQVRMQLTRTPDGLCLSVWNSGPPVPAEFDPRAQMGMGLRLIVDLAEQYGGSFTLRPEGEGTRAALTVPELSTGR